METVTTSAGLRLKATSMGQGMPLVMVHGLVFGNMASWYFPLALPLAAGRQVIVYDQRGHGDSDMVENGYDLATQAADLEQVIGHFGAGPVDLVGHSVGALIALQFAMQHPQRVGRLVLVDAPVPAARHVGPSLTAVTSVDDIDRFVGEHMVAQGSLSSRRRDRLFRRLTRLLFESSLVRDVGAMGEPDVEALTRVEAPVLLVYGKDSPCRRSGDWLLERLPRASLLHLDCGHYVPEEAPAALLGCVERFLAAGNL